MTASEPDAYQPTWYWETRRAAPERRALTADLDVDVCVIGAGLVGLTIARELGRRGWSVAVLEARRIASNASGRNAAVVAVGFGEPIERVVARLGLERAKALWALSVDGVDQVRRTMAETGMPGINPPTGKLVAQTVKGPSDACRADAALLQQEFASEVELWPSERVRAVLRSSSYFQALHFPDAFHVHPLDHALGLAEAAEKSGVRIFEQTRALAIDSDGVRKRVVTPAARVRAAQVVLATGGEGGSLHPRLVGTVIMLARPMAITQPLGDQLGVIGFSGTVEHAPFLSARYHLVGDRLLWAGPLTTAPVSPQRIAARMRRQIVQFYPQLRATAVAGAWSAPLAYTVHRMPQIGELAPGLWLAEALADHGINVTAMAGDLVASAIADGDDRWRLFTPYGLVWTGGRLGRTITTVALKVIGLQAWLRESLSRSDLPPISKEPTEVAINTKAAQTSPPGPFETRELVSAEAAVAEPAVTEAAVTGQTRPADQKKRNGSRRKVTANPSTLNELEHPVAGGASERPSKQLGGAVVRRPRQRKAKTPQAVPPPPPISRAEDPAGTDV